MSTELIPSGEFLPDFPGRSVPPVILRALEAYNRIQTLEDVEDYLLKGHGWSEHTIRSYLSSFRMFMEAKGGGTIFDVLPADLENWFDELAEGDPGTASLRLCGVRAVYRSLEKILPGSSPFNGLETRLEKKLKPKERELSALSRSQLLRIMAYLEREGTPGGRLDRTLIFFLSSSGLRAEEALSLRWKDLEKAGDRWTAHGIGKGRKIFHQELYPPAVEAVRDSFRELSGRREKDEDPLFLNLYGKPLTYHTAWTRIKARGEQIKARKMIRRTILFTPHLMRRTYATLLHAGGMAVKAVAGKTRHSNILTLEKHYLKNEEDARPYLDAIFRAEEGKGDVSV